jgi:hypothetical protein
MGNFTCDSCGKTFFVESNFKDHRCETWTSGFVSDAQRDARAFSRANADRDSWRQVPAWRV